MAIGAQTAEDIKFEIGSAAQLPEELATEIRGRDLTTGLPKAVMLTSGDMRQALAEPVQTIIDAIKNTLERTPPELAADISERGILLAGGGSLLQGFVERVRMETGMPAQLAESPLTCVAIGSGLSLEEYDAMSKLGSAFQAQPPVKRRMRYRTRVG
jgi:rod shape-determining protein MreB and related proteins